MLRWDPSGMPHLQTAVTQLRFFPKMPVSKNIFSFPRVWNFDPESEGLHKARSGFGDKLKTAKTLGSEIRSFLPGGGVEMRTVNFLAAVGLCFRSQPQ